jgi:chromosomal replication initiation ATPase DnaA
MNPYTFAGLPPKNQTLISQLLLPTLPNYSTDAFKLIVSISCEMYGITEKEFRSKSRGRNNVDARSLVCYVLRNVFHLSLQKIGILMLQNHATVLHNIRKIDDFLAIGDVDTHKKIEQIKKQLKLHCN